MLGKRSLFDERKQTKTIFSYFIVDLNSNSMSTEFCQLSCLVEISLRYVFNLPLAQLIDISQAENDQQ
jgi:hypothetical protein